MFEIKLTFSSTNVIIEHMNVCSIAKRGAEIMDKIDSIDLNLGFFESLIMASNNKNVLVKIFSINGGEGFCTSQRIGQVTIKKTNIGLEIKDNSNSDNLLKIYYSKIKDIQLMKASNTIITYIYDTLHIQVII